MDIQKQETIVTKLGEALEKIKQNDFWVYFFVLDTKGTPTGSISFIYDTALTLSEKGFNVAMLHQEDEFVGVGEWMGEKYGALPHFNISNDSVVVTTSDVLIIPELFYSVMKQSKQLPCKKVILSQNVNYITEFINNGEGWGDTGIVDVITTSVEQESMIKEYFPYMRTHVIRPKINDIFTESVLKKKLIVNIVSKDEYIPNKIAKLFGWKYPSLGWVTFATLRGLPKQTFAEALKEGVITIWVDTDSCFGYSPLEAMKSGSIVIGKIPEIIPGWMKDKEGGFRNNGVWFDSIYECPNLLANVIMGWLKNQLAIDMAPEMLATVSEYSETINNEDVEKVLIDKIIGNRAEEINLMLKTVKNNIENAKK